MAFGELEQRQSVMRGNGPYERIAATLEDIHELVMERLSPQPGERWRPRPSSPFDWGDPECVHELLGDAFDLELQEHVSTLETADGEEHWQLFATSYGPTKTLAESLDDERRAEFHRTWVEFFERDYGDDGKVVHPREYLLVLGTRRS